MGSLNEIFHTHFTEPILQVSNLIIPRYLVAYNENLSSGAYPSLPKTFYYRSYNYILLSSGISYHLIFDTFDLAPENCTIAD